MGFVIHSLKELAERIAKENKSKLFIGGILITFIVIFLSGTSGWLIERLFLFFKIKNPISSIIFFSFVLSSSLASRSLNKSILEITNKISSCNVVSILEGGYDLNALKESTEMHLRALIENK